MGHFSKFIKPAAKRVHSAPSRSLLLSTSFLNADGKLVVVVMNPTDKASAYYLWINGQAAQLESQKHSIETLIVE